MISVFPLHPNLVQLQQLNQHHAVVANGQGHTNESLPGNQAVGGV